MTSEPSTEYTQAKYAEALGNLLTSWGSLESMFVGILTHLLRTDYWRCDLLWRSFVSARSKLEYMQVLTWQFVEPSDEKTKLLDLLDRAHKINSKRNIYVHASWMSRGTQEPRLMLKAVAPRSPGHPFQTTEPVTPDDIIQTQKTLATLFVEMGQFLEDSVDKISIRSRPLPEPLPKPQENSQGRP